MKAKGQKTKFIATLDENKIQHIDKFAENLKQDGITVDQVSRMFGIISGKADASLDELKSKYEPKGMKIEPDRSVSIK